MVSAFFVEKFGGKKMKKERLIITFLLMLSVLLILPIRSIAAENESEEEFAVDIPDTGYSLRISGTSGRITEIYDFSDTQVPVFAYYVGDSYKWIYIGYASGGDVHQATRNDLASGFLDSYRYEYIYTDNGTVKTHDVYSTDGNHRTASNTALYIQLDTAYMFDELEGYLFDSLEAARSYFYGGDETGLINAPVPTFTFTENVSLDVPKIRRVFDSNSGDMIYLDNASDDYLVEIKGRWYSIDDIELYKENLMWKYRYSSIVHNSLSDWCSVNTDRYRTHTLSLNRVSTNTPISIADIGSDSFQDLLARYPIDSRSYTGGTNAVGNYFSGYSDALSMLKTIHLPNKFGDFNSYEIYVRYVYVNGSEVQYSKWAHFYTGIANPKGSSGSSIDDAENLNQEYLNSVGLTASEAADLEASGNSRSDSSAIPKLDFDRDWSNAISGMIDTSNQVFSLFQGLFGLMGSLPSMVNSVFGFLPSWFSQFIALSLGLVVIMRFIGR